MSSLLDLPIRTVLRPERVSVHKSDDGKKVRSLTLDYKIAPATTQETYQVPAAFSCALQRHSKGGKRTRCRGHLFAWMMSHDLEAGRKDTAIFYGANPVISTAMYYDGQINNKDTRMARGHWKIEVVTGPFASRAAAETFCQQWVTGTRGKKSKIVTAMQLAANAGIPFHWAAISPPTSRLAYLREHGPDQISAAIDTYLVEKATRIE